MGKILTGLRAIIAERKETTGLTQKKLEEMMGAKPAMVSCLLKGRRQLSERWIEKFCAALNVTLGDIEKAMRWAPEPKASARKYRQAESSISGPVPPRFPVYRHGDGSLVRFYFAEGRQKRFTDEEIICDFKQAA
jgi:transcriptional regulator with XRE-family HTH domain